MRAKTSPWMLTLANCIGLSSLAIAASAPPPPPADELQRWIAERAVAVRTIDAADEDFSDLEPLIDAIGSARVVQLGEPSHGAGGSFAAKVRLVKFLHQRMGFDVLAWESGLYDVQLTQAAMRGGDDAVSAAHNVHVMNAHYAADVRSIHLEPQTGGLKPSGVALAKWLGDGVYTIAMTCYEGEDGWRSANAIAPAPGGSLESRLHRLGKPYVFVDFRALDGSPGHPLRQPQSMRIDKYRNDTLTDVTRAFDAVFYLDRMIPATPIRRADSSAAPAQR